MYEKYKITLLLFHFLYFFLGWKTFYALYKSDRVYTIAVYIEKNLNERREDKPGKKYIPGKIVSYK